MTAIHQDVFKLVLFGAMQSVWIETHFEPLVAMPASGSCASALVPQALCAGNHVNFCRLMVCIHLRGWDAAADIC